MKKSYALRYKLINMKPQLNRVGWPEGQLSYPVTIAELNRDRLFIPGKNSASENSIVFCFPPAPSQLLIPAIKALSLPSHLDSENQAASSWQVSEFITLCQLNKSLAWGISGSSLSPCQQPHAMYSEAWQVTTESCWEAFFSWSNPPCHVPSFPTAAFDTQLPLLPQLHPSFCVPVLCWTQGASFFSQTLHSYEPVPFGRL